MTGRTDAELLDALAKSYGYTDPLKMIEASLFDSVAPGICRNPGCDFTTDVEPDATANYCEICETQTVVSCQELMFELYP